MSRLFVMILCASGCIDTRLVPCGDLACPPGFTCTVAMTCASPAQVAECTGDPDGATCEGGTCLGGACITATCGNDILEYSEGCDDGNRMPGDGCSADCTSNEACGNSVTDFPVGEQCDDGNPDSFDGCARDCRSERLGWRPRDTATSPSPRATTVAYDRARHRVVAFAGSDASGARSDTWEYDGLRWTQISPREVPPPRVAVGMTYDANRNRVIAFGGSNGLGTLHDTWAYDGVTWTRIVTPTVPPARAGAALAFDSTRGCVVMFGGHPVFAADLDDTWELDGNDWVERIPATRPPARTTSIAYDPIRARTVMFGGSGANGVMNDTWEWDGTTWTQRTPATSPSVRSSLLAWDAARGTVVTFAGVASLGYAGDMWEWNGTDWTTLTFALPPARFGLAIAYDDARARLVMFGGARDSFVNPTYLADTWELVGSEWIEHADADQPTARDSTNLAYDAGRGVTVMFGGNSSSNPFQRVALDDTWELAGTTWIPRTPTARPPERFAPALAYDRSHHRTVVFGGAQAGGVRFGDTWTYDGTTWTELATTNAPSPRAFASMVYDAKHDRILLYGGEDGTTNAQAGYTWALDGDTWTVVSTPATSPSPSPRFDASLAYDSSLERVVLFGGRDWAKLNDTWILDGDTWTEISNLQRPSGRSAATLAYDPLRRRAVLFGGDGEDGTSRGDTWELDGSTWTQLQNDPNPVSRVFAMMAYDDDAHQLVMFGGSRGTLLADTWFLATTPRFASEACREDLDYDLDGKAGCADRECAHMCDHCGDHACTGMETCRSCPSDCPMNTATCPLACGDLHCDAGETHAMCPGDCP